MIRNSSHTELYQYCADEEGNALVALQLERVAEVVARAGIRAEALVITGSFGRGEGVTYRTKAGKVKAANDYDIMVVTKHELGASRRKQLREIAKELASELDVWHIDLMPFTETQLSHASCSMFFYDSKFGSHVFYGRKDILDLLPITSASTIPHTEFLNLLINRTVTLLEAHPALKNKLSREQKFRQLAKVFFALVDAYCGTKENYQTSYSQKAATLAQYSRDEPYAALLTNQVDAMTAAWKMKLDDLALEELMRTWDVLRSQVVQHIASLTQSPGGSEDDSVASTLLHWRRGDWDNGNLWNRALGGLYRRFSGRPHKIDVEKKIYLSLTVYPEANDFKGSASGGVSISAPPYDERKTPDSHQNLEWGDFVHNLVEDWYRSGS